LVLFLQVFFCVMVGSFSLGNAAPNIGTFFTGIFLCYGWKKLYLCIQYV
jgi:hypothetical protein